MDYMENNIPRPEHPRPDFMRDTFLNLNGTWQFAFDDDDAGLKEGWYRPGYPLGGEIVVPFCYQSKASGIGPTDEIHPVMWYRRSFTVPEEMCGRRILIRFGAVDFEATVYVNGHAIGSHKGGYTPFALDATDFLVKGENDLCLWVEDYPDPIQPRGKQYWKQGLWSCMYTSHSGIWQTVYLEAVNDLRMEYVHVTPDIDRGVASVEILLNHVPDREVTLSLNVSLEGQKIRRVTASTVNRNVTIPVDLDVRDTFNPVALWEPRSPKLYDLRVELSDEDALLDRVDFADRDFIEKQTCEGRRAYADGYSCTGGEAVMVTEYGGIAFANIGIQGELGGMETWGYHGKETDEEAFFKRYEACTRAVLDIPFCQGYCYTQLTDVMQEINGLLTPDRKPKMDVQRVNAQNVNPYK